MQNEIIQVVNNGLEIEATNFWETEVAAKGRFYVSVNAGTFRLLVPPSQEGQIAEMKTGEKVIISRGLSNVGDIVEILFDDGSESPYALFLSPRAFDRFPCMKGYPVGPAVGCFPFTIWVQGEDKQPHCVWGARCSLRKAMFLPWVREYPMI